MINYLIYIHFIENLDITNACDPTVIINKNPIFFISTIILYLKCLNLMTAYFQVL